MVFAGRDACPHPLCLHMWLGSQLPCECVEIPLLFPSLMPGINLSVFSFCSKEWAGVCSCLVPFHCGGFPSAAFTSWAPGITIPFPLSPLPAPDLSDGGHPNTTPLAVSPVQQAFLFRKLRLLQTSPLSFSSHFCPRLLNYYIWNVPWMEEWSSSQMIAVADCSIC